MATAHAEQTAVILASPDRVYAVLADYNHHHPRILPTRYFSNLVVEEGGIGSGTIFKVTVRVMGRVTHTRMAVTEPQPGFVLRETDLETGLVTQFILSPVRDGEQTRLMIATDWDLKPGPAGILERWLTPPILRRIYRAELTQLAGYLGREAAAG